MEAHWTELWSESDQRTSAEPVLCLGLSALGDGGSGANRGKTESKLVRMVFSGKVRAPIRDAIAVRPETAQLCITQPSAQQENQGAVFCQLSRVICTRTASLLTPSV